jgi:hypothetical protein
LKTYALHYTQAVFGGTVDLWIPAPPASIKQGFSLYSILTSALNTETDIENNSEFLIFPSPTFDQVTVRFSNNKSGSGKVSVTNLIGITVYSSEMKWESGKNEFKLSLKELPTGVYFINLDRPEENLICKKIIKE